MNKDFENFLNHFTKPAIYLNVEGHVLFLNNAASKLFDIQNPCNTEGVDFWESWHIYTHDGHEIDYTQNPSINAINSGSPNDGTILKLISRTNHSKEIFLSIDVIPDIQESNLEVAGTFVLCDDITYSRKLENDIGRNIRSLNHQRNNLEKFINAQTAFLVITDMEGIIKFANRSYLKSFKKAHIDKKGIGESALDSVMSYHHEMVLEKIKECISKPSHIVKVQMDKPKEDGGILHTLWDFKLELDELGNPFEIICTGIDNTELIKMQEKLLYNERKYRSLIEAADALVSVVDENGHYILVNSKSAAMIGQTPDFFIGKTIWETMGKTDGDAVMKNVRKAIKENDGFTTERSVVIQGKEIWFRSNFQVLDKITDEPVSVMIMTSNITKEVMSERLIKESEAKYRSLVESSDGIIAMFDPKGGALFANDHAAKMVGMSVEEAIASKFNLKSIFPKDRQKNIDKDIKTIIETKEGISEVIELELNGQTRYFKSSFQPVINQHGSVEAVLLNASDITLEKEQAKKIEASVANFKSLFYESPQAYLVIQDNKFVECNETSMKLMASDREYIVGKRPEQISPKIQLNGVTSKVLAEQYFDKVKKEGNFSFEWTNKKQNGLTILTHVDLFITEYNGRESILCLWRDITEERKIQEKIKQSEENFKTLFYDSPQAYLVIQEEHFVECNRASEKLMNATRDQIINMPPAMISPEFQPNGKTSAEMAREYFDAVYKEGSIQFEWVHLKVTGEPFLAEVNLTKTVYQGKDSILVLWRDIAIEKENLKRVHQLSQIVNQSPVSVVMTDKVGSIEYINPNVIKQLGYSEQEIIGQKPGMWRFDRDEPDSTKELWDTIRKGETWKGRFKNRTKNGDPIFESSTIFPVFNDNGEIENYVAIQENITEKLKQEEEINLFKEVFDDAVNGRLITDMDGQILYCNEYYAEMHDIAKENVIGKNYVDHLSDVSVPQHMVLRKRLLALKRINSAELEHRKNEGQTFPALINASIISDQQGNDQFISISVIDITERKKIENEIIELNLKLEEKVKERTSELMAAVSRLETFFEVSLDMLCIANQQGQFIKLSKAFEDVLHYKRSELEGAQFLEFVHEEDIDSTLAAMADLQNNRRIVKFVNRYRTKEGGYRFIEWYSSPVGNFIYAVARDVTEQTQKEIELIQARRSAEEANASKSNFLSRMSHELRTPMNSILGFAQLLEMGELSDTQEASVKHILTSGRHLLQLINEVLEISRIEAGSINLSIEPVNITNSIKSICAMVAPLAEKEKIQIVYDKSINDEYKVIADNQRINQILTNLISNAIKYNNENGKVYLSLEPMESEGGITMIRVNVKDTGIGISANDQAKLFNPFERLGAQNSSIEGTGLGLAVTKELVQALNGNIGLESEPGQGSTFWFEFPKCTSDNLALFEVKQRELEKIVVAKKKASVVYIEDNEMNLNLVKDIFKLKRPKFDLAYSISGKEGIAQVIDCLPDLVLLDLDLPDMHGSEVLKKLKKEKNCKDIPVIIVSADATEDNIKKLKKEGAAHYITKPIDIACFLDILDSYLDH